MTVYRVTSLALAAALLAMPALAQNATTTSPGATTGAPAGTATPSAGLGTTEPTPNHPLGTMTAGHTQTANPVLTENGEVRASKVIGAAVYDDKDHKLGSVDDILLGKDHKATQAVIAVGEVLGVGGKLVAVPYDKLHFPARVGSTTSRVMMPGTTENALKGMPDFHYASR